MSKNKGNPDLAFHLENSTIPHTNITEKSRKTNKGNKYTREDFLKCPQKQGKEDKHKKDVSSKKKAIKTNMPVSQKSIPVSEKDSVGNENNSQSSVGSENKSQDSVGSENNNPIQNIDEGLMLLLSNRPISEVTVEQVVSHVQTSGNDISVLVETLFHFAITNSHKIEDTAVLCQRLHKTNNSGKYKSILCRQNFRDIVSSYCKSMFLKYFVIHNTNVTEAAVKTNIFTKRRILNITVTPPSSDPVKLEHRFNIMKFFGHLFICDFFLVTYINFMLWRLLQNKKQTRVYSECALNLLQVILHNEKFLSFGISQYLIVIFHPDNKFWSQYWLYSANRETWTKFLENENVKKYLKGSNYWYSNPPVCEKVQSLWSREKEKKAEKKYVLTCHELKHVLKECESGFETL